MPKQEITIPLFSFSVDDLKKIVGEIYAGQYQLVLDAQNYIDRYLNQLATRIVTKIQEEFKDAINEEIEQILKNFIEEKEMEEIRAYNEDSDYPEDFDINLT